jgi:hypothetical protein
MATKFKVVADIPHGSGDAEWRIVRDKALIAIVDPQMTHREPRMLAYRLADALNRKAPTHAALSKLLDAFDTVSGMLDAWSSSGPENLSKDEQERYLRALKVRDAASRTLAALE